MESPVRDGVARSYQMCVRCVMDTTDPDIQFDANGVCHHCHRFEVMEDAWLPPEGTGRAELERVAERIRREGRGKDYDCVIGVSGGVDSSYVAYVVREELGLRPLAVHLDNGWDSELAVQNIENVLRRLDIDLHTHVIDWPEFRDLQRSFIKAGVVDIELLTDHAITAILYRTALREKVRFILSGSNVATEAIMPTKWTHRKSDLRNLKAIHRRFGERPLSTFPTASTLRLQWWTFARRIENVAVLNYLDYDKQAAMKVLEEQVGWRYYGGKHYESVFTRFYQGHLLPAKFNVDKRRAHLSAMILSGRITRDEALAELREPPISDEMRATEQSYVAKKLGFSDEGFDRYLHEPGISHYAYPSEEALVVPLMKVKRLIRRIGGRVTP